MYLFWRPEVDELFEKRTVSDDHGHRRRGNKKKKNVKYNVRAT